MHAGKLDVLGDGVTLDFSVTGHRVNLHFLRALQELGSHHRMLLAHHHGILQGTFQLFPAGDHLHGGTGEHVGRTDHNGKAHLIGKGIHILHAGEFFPAGLVDAQGVAHPGEFLAVFGHIDGPGAGSKDPHPLRIQLQGQVVGNLATGRDNHAQRAFQLADIQHPLQGQFIKEEAVAHVVIRAHGLGIVVDHNGPVAHLLDLLHGRYAAPVKLHAGADAVRAAAQHNHGPQVFLKLYIVRRAIVGKVQVIGGGRVLPRHRIYLLHARTDAQGLAKSPYLQAAGVAVRAAGAGNQAAHLPVREAQLLGTQEGIGIQLLQGAQLLQAGAVAEDVLQAEEEPLVNLGDLVDPVYGIALLEGLHDGQDALVRRMLEFGLHILYLHVVAQQAVQALPYHPEAFLDAFLEGPADGHHLAHRLHRGAQLAGNTFEFAQIPAGDLTHDIVQRRLKAGRCHLRHRVGDFVQAQPEAQLGSHEGQRIAGGLGSQGRGAAEAGVHLDHAVIFRLRIQGVLHVALSHDAHVADDLDGNLAEAVVFPVAEGLGRSHHDAFSRMDAQRVEVLHITDGDTVVVTVPHHLVFNFFPSLEGLLDKNLGRVGEGR